MFPLAVHPHPQFEGSHEGQCNNFLLLCGCGLASLAAGDLGDLDSVTGYLGPALLNLSRLVTVLLTCWTDLYLGLKQRRFKVAQLRGMRENLGKLFLHGPVQGLHG